MEITLWLPKTYSPSVMVGRLRDEGKLVEKMSLADKEKILEMIERTAKIIQEIPPEIVSNSEVKITPLGIHILKLDREIKTMLYRFD